METWLKSGSIDKTHMWNGMNCSIENNWMHPQKVTATPPDSQDQTSYENSNLLRIASMLSFSQLDDNINFFLTRLNGALLGQDQLKILLTKGPKFCLFVWMSPTDKLSLHL